MNGSLRAAARRPDVHLVELERAFAEAARRNGWVRPTVDDGERIEIRGGVGNVKGTGWAVVVEPA